MVLPLFIIGSLILSHSFAIALGGALGALSRFWVSDLIYQTYGRSFPWGTLAVNLLGSFLIGFLYILLDNRFNDYPELRAILMVGFLGAFTTFSTFSLDSFLLIESGYWFKALINILSNVFACLFAVWLGFLIGRFFFD